MPINHLRDTLGGLILIVGGTLFAGYSWTHYNMGTLRQMGPGLFPTSLGVILALFGVAILIGGLLQRQELPEFRIRPTAFVLIAVAIFALTIRPFGIVPAIMATTFAAAMADEKFRPKSTLFVGAGLVVTAYVVFKVGLGLSLAVLRWPF